MTKSLLPVVLALVAGCVSVPTTRNGSNTDDRPVDTPAERSQRMAAHDAFRTLQRAWIEGDAQKVLELMSVQQISDWFLARTRDKGDADWSVRLAKLDAPRKVEFDAWVRRNKSIQIPIGNARSEILPESILRAAWLRETWAHYFEPEKASLQQNAKKMQVQDEDVYVEGTGMSVLVRLNNTPTLLYSMVQEGESWKFDYVVRPAAKTR
jgi:hypothetical protein